MPLIPQQHFLTAIGLRANATEDAWADLQAQMDKLPPVRIISMNVQCDHSPLEKPFEWWSEGMIGTTQIFVVVEEI